jgi:predicted PurR-regulated permease PerM
LSKQETKEVAATAARTAVEVVGPPTRVILRVIFIILFVAVSLWIIVKLTGVILLLVLSIFFAYLVSPLVDFLTRTRTISGRSIKIPRAIAIILSYLIILGAIAVAVLVVLPTLSNQLPEFATQAKNYWKTVGDQSQQLNQWFRNRRIPGPVVDAVNQQIPIVVEKVGATVSEFVTAS